MRAGSCTLQQTLTAEAATVVKNGVGLARQRGHAQATPLHVAATLLASDTSLLRRACMQSHCLSGSHPLQCRALELCFNVALNRLPASLHGQPSLSNALIAALKRAQAHQRRGCVEQQQQQQPLLAVKVEMEQLILSILDDPSVSRVMREAGFQSTNVKNHVEEIVTSAISRDSGQSTVMLRSFPACTAQQIGPNRSCIINFCAPSSLTSQQSFATDDRYLLRINSPGLQVSASSEIYKPSIAASSENFKPSASLIKDVGSVIKGLLTTQKRRVNTVIVGEDLAYSETVIKALIGRIEAGDVPETLKGVKLIIPQFSSFLFRLLDKEDVEHKVGELRKILKSCTQVAGRGAIIYVGDLRWAVMDQNYQASDIGPPHQHNCYSSAEHVALELGRILRSSRAVDQQLWLMATATYQTYVRCNMRKPSLETLWGALHPVIVPLGSLSLTLHPSTTIHEGVQMEGVRDLLSDPIKLDKAMTASSDADGLHKSNCYSKCATKFDEEPARSIVGHSSETQRTSAFPYWLHPYKNNDEADQATVSISSGIRVRDLSTKWDQQCSGIHSHETQIQRKRAEMQMQLEFCSPSSRIPSCWSTDVDRQARLAAIGSCNYSSPNNYEDAHGKNFFFNRGCRAVQNETRGTSENPMNWSVIDENSTRICFTDRSIRSDVAVENASGNICEWNTARCQQETMRSNIGEHQGRGFTVETTLSLGRSSSSDHENTLSNKVSNVAGQEEYCSNLKLSHIDANSPDSVSISAGRNRRADRFNVSLRKFDPESLEFFCKGLEEKVNWQTDAIRSIATTVLKCRSGMRRKLIGRDNLDAAIWMLFLGSDWIGKRRIAKALAEILYGSEEKLLRIGLCREYSNLNCHHGTNLDEGLSFSETFTEAVRLNPHSVVLLEEIGHADPGFKATLCNAMERGRLIDSQGNEVLLYDTIIIMTSAESGSKCLGAYNSRPGGLLAGMKTGMKFLVMEEGGTDSKNVSKLRKSHSIPEHPTFLCPCKRKAAWDAQDIGMNVSEKRKSKSSCLNLNHSAEENELALENVQPTTNNSTDVEAADQHIFMEHSISKEFLNLIDKIVVFQPFDLNQITQNVVNRMNSAFSRATGEKFGCLRIDGTVLDYLVNACSWHYSLDHSHPFDRWMHDVFEGSLGTVALSLHKITADKAIGLVADEVDSDDYHGNSLALPTKIDVTCFSP